MRTKGSHNIARDETPTARLARLLSFVTKPNGEHGCWIWGKAPNKSGYGQISMPGGGVAMTHRVSYALQIGPIPEGLTLDHLCRNRICVNPHHLEAVTSVENVRRGISPPATNARKRTCKRGHELAGPNIIWKRQPSGRYYRNCRTCRNDQRRLVA